MILDLVCLVMSRLCHVVKLLCLVSPPDCCLTFFQMLVRPFHKKVGNSIYKQLYRRRVARKQFSPRVKLECELCVKCYCKSSVLSKCVGLCVCVCLCVYLCLCAYVSLSVCLSLYISVESKCLLHRKPKCLKETRRNTFFLQAFDRSQATKIWVALRPRLKELSQNKQSENAKDKSSEPGTQQVGFANQ